jgi:acyl-CoA hydrolase
MAFMTYRKAAMPARRISASEAAGLVRSGMWIDYGTGLAQPDVFDAALGDRIGELTDVKIRSCITLRPRAPLEADPTGEHVHLFSLHFSGYDRKLHDAGRCHYLPVNLGEIPDYYRRFMPAPDIAILKTRPMDAEGFFNFGPTNLWQGAILERARIVIVETDQAMPYAYGNGARIHKSAVDYIVEGDNRPLPELPNPPTTEIERAVARLIAPEIEDGSCLQIGIGGMPNAVCGLLAESGVKDLGVHSEMLPDGIVDLYRRGRINGSRKALDPGKIVYSFALGTAELYRTIDGNDDLLCNPVDYTNSPHVIMRNPKVVAINSTTQIDLQGQAASESDGKRHLTGTGGQLQFVRGAYASEGGKSFICLPSTYDKRGERRSRIVIDLTPGNVVTTPRTDMMYVVTEYGITNLKGKTVPERARALIGIAHPDFREGLEREAYALRIIPRGVSFDAVPTATTGTRL